MAASVVPWACSLTLVVLAVSAIMGGADSTSFDITNSCAYTVRAVISPGAGAAAALDRTGFVLAPGESRAVPVPSSVWSGRLWGRCTDCGSADSCQDCAGGNAAPPVTLVEFTIDGSRGIDLYDISVVDGYNLPVLVEPRGAAAPGPGGRCAPTACVLDLDSECPAELRVPSSSAGTGAAAVACQSACLAFGTPQYCCTGAYGSADTCRPSAYSDVFKRACPQAVSYAYDADSVFTCRAGETGVSYTVTFCPASTSSGPGTTGREQPTPYNANGEGTSGSEPLGTSVLVAILGLVTAILGVVAAVLGVWKKCCCCS